MSLLLSAVVCLATLALPALSSQVGKGVASNSQAMGGPCNEVDDLKASWWYNWALTASRKPNESCVTESAFVPMVWGVDAVKKLASGELNTSAPALLGFNEPDNAGQSNILPAVAASLWPQLEATGMRLGSPAVSVGHQWWLEQFFGNCTGCRVDFITVHWYAEWGGGCSPNAFIKYVNRFTKYGKPLWGLLPTLTATVPLLERYAWFTTRSQEANWSNVTLVDSNGTFTELGEYFSQQ